MIYLLISLVILILIIASGVGLGNSFSAPLPKDMRKPAIKNSLILIVVTLTLSFISSLFVEYKIVDTYNHIVTKADNKLVELQEKLPEDLSNVKVVNDKNEPIVEVDIDEVKNDSESK